MYGKQRKVFALIGALRKSSIDWLLRGLVSPGAPEIVVSRLRDIADEVESRYEAMINAR